jgi:hypothetical protein
MKLTEHFTLEELCITQHRSIDNTPPSEIMPNLKRLAEESEKVISFLGHKGTTTSGYRCPKLNAAVHGSSNSRHMLGLARDFICPELGTPIEVCRKILDSDLPFDQLIQEWSWVHYGLCLPGGVPRRQVFTLIPGGMYAMGLTERMEKNG